MIELFESILIHESTSTKEVIKKLDVTQEKIIFVIDGKNRLVGSVTDGDIRRWILKDGDLNVPIEEVCYKGTFTVRRKFNIDQVKSDMSNREISHVPVVDDDNIIIDILVWDKLFEHGLARKIVKRLEVEIVIMAGGKGSRLDPFTKILPKPLIPIGDKTILEIIIEKFTAYHVNEFYISLNHKAKIIKSYFEELNPKYKIHFIEEDKPLGTVGALKVLEDQITNNILLTNCDIIVKADYWDLLQHHIMEKNDITIVTSLKHYNIPYGICEIENGGQIVEIKEKPEYDLLVNTGMYILRPEVLQYIPEDEFFHITSLIDKIKLTHKIGIYPISENSWIDTGEWVEYKKAVEKLRL